MGQESSLFIKCLLPLGPSASTVLLLRCCSSCHPRVFLLLLLLLQLLPSLFHPRLLVSSQVTRVIKIGNSIAPTPLLPPDLSFFRLTLAQRL